MPNRLTMIALGAGAFLLSACEPPQTVVVSPAPVPPPQPVITVDPGVQTLPAAPVYDPNYVNPVEDPPLLGSGEAELIDLGGGADGV